MFFLLVSSPLPGSTTRPSHGRSKATGTGSIISVFTRLIVKWVHVLDNSSLNHPLQSNLERICEAIEPGVSLTHPF